MPKKKPFYTVKELVELIASEGHRVSANAIHARISRGTIVADRIGNTLIVHSAEVDRLRRSGKLANLST